MAREARRCAGWGELRNDYYAGMAMLLTPPRLAALADPPPPGEGEGEMVRTARKTRAFAHPTKLSIGRARLEALNTTRSTAPQRRARPRRREARARTASVRA